MILELYTANEKEMEIAVSYYAASRKAAGSSPDEVDFLN
jgi:hypothetical protein